MGKFLKLVRGDVQSLISTRHLNVESEVYEEAHFGNGLLVLVGQDIRIRISRDRSIFEVEIGATRGENWWFLVDVCTLLGIRDLNFREMTLDAKMRIVESNFAGLEDRFASSKMEATEAQLRSIKSARADALISRLGLRKEHS